jgi:hypothetical protein
LKLKQTLNDLLMHFLKSKYKLKSSNELKEIFNEKINGILYEDEWRKMINEIYDNEDVLNLENKINEFLRKKNSNSNNNYINTSSDR